MFNSTRTDKKRLLSKPFSDLRRDDNAETILKTFSITFQQVQEQSPLAGSLLKLIACIDRQGIPHELLAASGLEGSDDEMTLADALSKLINLALLTCLKKSEAYEMHSLVHVSVEAFLLAEDMNTAIEQTTKSLGKVLPDGGYEYREAWAVYLPHVTAWSGHVKAVSLDIAEIYFSMSRYLLYLGRYSDAEDKAKRVVKARTDHEELGQENLGTLACMANLAQTYNMQGRQKEAEVLKVQVLEARRRVLGQEHPDALTSMSNLAATYSKQGRQKEAEVLMGQVLEARRRVLGQEHPDTLTSMFNLATINSEQGRQKNRRPAFNLSG